MDDSLILTPLILQGIEPFYYSWGNGDSSSFLSFNPPVDTSFNVTITDACGIDTTATFVTGHISTLPLTLSSVIDSINCVADSLAITPLVTGGSKSLSYLWSTGQKTDSIKVRPNADTKYYVTVTDFCDSLNPLIDSILVKFFSPAPTTSTKNDTISCTQSNTITVDVQKGSNQYSFLWSNGYNTQSAIISSVGNDITYYVTVTDQCLPGVSFIDSVKVFEVNEPLSISTKDTILNCNLSLIDIGPKIITGGQFQRYEWSTGDKTQSIKVNPSTTTKYFVTVTDSCFLSSPLVDSILVTVTTPSLNIVADDTSFNCPANNFSISVVVLTGQAPISYQWSSGQTSSSFMVSMSNDTSFIVTVTDGCGASRTDTLNIIFNLSPDLVSTMNDTVLACLGDTAFLKPFISGGTPPYQYIWQRDKALKV